MSEGTCRSQIQTDSQQLLDGPLKHVRAAALAAALVPLASLVATPASAQDPMCASAGTVCGFVFNDVNKNGIQDAGETGIPMVKVTISDASGPIATTETGSGGFYFFFVPDGTYTISVQIPVGYAASPPNVGSNRTIDSDGVPDGLGNSVATNVIVNVAGTGFPNSSTDFGFFLQPSVLNPGAGTPGYWKNHPEAWPVAGITVGGVMYTRDQAISWLQRVGKDKTTTMFSSLVSAMLNVMIGNDPSCVQSTINAANAWMATYGPVGSNVAASSQAWAVGEPLHIQMDNYNNGRLCAPHRQ